MRLHPKAKAYAASSICLLLAGPAQAACSGAILATSRLVAKGATVYDRQTDLTWARCSVGMKWVEGKGCLGVAARGTWRDANGVARPGGWRIPAPEELETILEKNCDNPSIADRVFPNTVSGWYWTNRSGGTSCWTVSFSDGHTASNPCNAYFAARLVKNGQ